jgi:hypothetical protein
MKKITLVLLAIISLLPSGTIASNNNNYTSEAVSNENPVTQVQPDIIKALYDRFPQGTFNFEAFVAAMKGYAAASAGNQIKKTHLLTLIDFSLPSSEERFFVLDLNDAKILFKSLVAHGRNTGENIATNFSNQAESYQSSLGFYLTAESYVGKNGFSLKLDGLEKNINDNARERGIVIHAADYVSQDFVAQHGRLGRSQGCPALPNALNQKVIDCIKGGSLLFIYAPQEKYFQQSAFLKTTTDLDCLAEVFVK